MDVKELQARLRHTSPQSTARYSRHVRCLAELANIDECVATWADTVEAQIGDILHRQLRPPLPEFLRENDLAK